MEIKTRFKKTPIGEIPEDWEVVRLGEIAQKIKTGPFGSQLRKSELTNSGIKVYTQDNVLRRDFSLGNLYISPEKFKQLKSMEIKPGDILLTIRGTVGKAAVVPEGVEKGIIHTNLAIIRVGHGVLWPEYLERIINDSEIILRQVHAARSSTTLPALYAGTIKRLKIPLPPLPEQKKIAEILRTVDEAIEKTDEAIERTERLKKGLMQRLLTKGIKHERFKKTELGEIPEEWRILKLREVGKLSSGKPRPSKICENPSDSCRFPVLGGNGILGYTSSFLIEYETIVIGRVGEYCGAVYKVPPKVWITDNALYFREINRELNLDFLTYYLSWMNLNRFKKKSGQPLLTQSILYELKLAVPSLSEQKQIAEILSTVDRKLELLRKRREKLERVKRGLMKDLLTGRRRVNCVD